MSALSEHDHLPGLVQSYLARCLPAGELMPAAVRVLQVGEMWKKPGARSQHFTATEDFAVDRVAFSWRAKFPIVGPLAMTVVDRLARGEGQLRVSFPGVPLQTQAGPETTAGEAMRYLAELPWAPHAIATNNELEWREVDERTVEVATRVPEAKVAVRWHFDDAGDLVGATGERPYPVGKTYVSRPWGGCFGEYARFGSTRAPMFAEAWWQLPEGRFVYWRGRVAALELLGRYEKPRPAADEIPLDRTRDSDLRGQGR